MKLTSKQKTGQSKLMYNETNHGAKVVASTLCHKSHKMFESGNTCRRHKAINDTAQR